MNSDDDKEKKTESAVSEKPDSDKDGKGISRYPLRVRYA